MKINFHTKDDNTCISPPDVGMGGDRGFADQPWPVNKIISTHNFTVNIGPTGGDKGYPVITGKCCSYKN